MLRRTTLTFSILIGSAALSLAIAQDKPKPEVPSKPPADTAKAKKNPLDIEDKVKSSKKTEGLFTLYQDTANGSVQIYLKKDQLGKEFIYQSFSLSGPNQLYLNQSMHRENFVVRIQKSFDKIEFNRVNTNLYYNPDNPVSKTKDVDKPEAIIISEKIIGEDSLGFLIKGDGLFLSEKLDPIRPVVQPGPAAALRFNLGALNAGKSNYYALRSYPKNTDVIVDLAYDNPNPLNGGGPDISDARYNRIRMQHTFIEMPDEHFYQPRYDDPRVGYFLTQVNDVTSISPTPYKDMIHRWNLVKKDPSAALSEPVEPIVYWIENTTPLEYRETIKEAGLKWNEAFEKAGFKNAIQMKIMPDDADWDPADIRYNVIRWVSSATPTYGAIGPSFVNPRTGEILGADITIEWFSGSAVPIADELYNGAPSQDPPDFPGLNMENYNSCLLGTELKAEYVAGLTTLETAGAGATEIKEMHKEFLTYLIMHEMGHTLGLNHNMKASQMLSPTEVNDKKITRKIGLIGSVMDYPAINVSLDRSKQGDYFTTKAGPYDLWAIEFGYKPFTKSDEEKGLEKILSRSTDPQLAFGNDADDMRSPGKAIDPRVMINDMSNDAISYAEDRFKLINNLMGKLVTKYSKPNQSYAELRIRYNNLNGQRNWMIAGVSRYIGGVYVDRSFPDQHSTTKPFTPVPVATQKKAMTILSKYVFAPDAFSYDLKVYPYLQIQRRGFNIPSSGEDYKITGISSQLQGSALAHLLHPYTLQRMTNSRLYGNKYSVSDEMNDLVNAIFSADLKTNVNVYRQYLQNSFVEQLTRIADPKNNMYDDVSKAAALYTLKKIKTLLGTAVSENEETRALRTNLIFMINQALEPK